MTRTLCWTGLGSKQKRLVVLQTLERMRCILSSMLYVGVVVNTVSFTMMVFGTLAAFVDCESGVVMVIDSVTI